MIDRADLDQVAARVRKRLEELDISGLPELMSWVLVRLRQRFEAGACPLTSRRPKHPTDPE